MKKTAIAFAVAAFAATSVQAAPQANTFYTGLTAGWSEAHIDINQLKHTPNTLGTGEMTTDRNSLTYGIFAGYQINDFLATEFAYDYFGHFKANNSAEKFKMKNHGASLSIKGSYPIIDGLDVYGRVGAALVRSDYKLGEYKDHSLKVSPVYAAGLEYAPMQDLAVRLEYRWLNKVGKFENAKGDRFDFTPSLGSVTAGVSYRFGQAAPVEPVIIDQTFVLSSDVTFGFDKATLKPEAKEALETIYADISNVTTENMTVAGYTDRLGNAKYNQKLSQRRADSVANFFVNKGVAQETITATGYGEANSVTGNTCDAVKGKKALIACLAPDRRVEISVQGQKVEVAEITE